VVIARIFNSYGPRMARFVILDFLKKLRATPERLEVLGTGQQVRDFTYVADTVAGLMTLATGGVPGEAYNISSGATCSVRELADKIIAARGLTGTARIECTGTSWVGDAQRWEVAIDKLRARGYAPRVTLPEGLERTIDWFDTTFGAESAA
jgi:nucleoside-diphosphate-sugar epimerase